jgi:hypothetical protein
MTECTTRSRNPVDARMADRLESVSRWSALFVGGLSVVLVERVVRALPLGDTASALAAFPVALAVMYVLLSLAARLE